MTRQKTLSAPDSSSETPPERRAVVLLSGGLDSTTVLAIAKHGGYRVYALSFDYGQKNRFELERAAAIAGKYAVADHRLITIDLRAFGGSSLTTDEPVARSRSLSEIGRGIPATYVPVRNTLFLTYALAWAEVLPAANIFIGVNALDTSGYPDCRSEYLRAFERLANLGTRYGSQSAAGFTVHAPLQDLTKAQIIKRGTELGVDYSLTNTCYDPLANAVACGLCDACILRQKGFNEAGLVDPIHYAEKIDFGSCSS